MYQVTALSSPALVHSAHRSKNSQNVGLSWLHHKKPVNAVLKNLKLSRKDTQVSNRGKALIVSSSSGVNEAASSYASLMVRDFMTSPALSISPEATIEEAIELLVEKGVSGLPVVEDDGTVLGVLSGFDIIALDKTPGHVDTSDGLFPQIGSCERYGGDTNRMWGDFMDLQSVAEKANSDTIGQIMHDAYTISIDATMEEAASMVVNQKVHRLTILDDEGKLAGVLSRGDIVRATLATIRDSIAEECDMSGDDEE